MLEDGKIDVNPDDMEARLVRRRIVGEDDEHGACYLIARDILKVSQPLLSATVGTKTTNHAAVYNAPNTGIAAVGKRQRSMQIY